MQSHQQHQKEQKHHKNEEKHEKQKPNPFKIPPIIIQCQKLPHSRANIPMQTTYLNGTPSFAGSFESPFNDDIKQMMGLTNQIILNGIKREFPQATNVYFKDPVGDPNGYYIDFFRLQGLTPVVARWKPVQIQIFDTDINSVTLAQKFITNNLDRELLYKVELSYETSETTTSGWNKEFSQSLGKSANAGINIKFVSAGVTIETTQTTTIGQSQEFSRTLTLGSSSGIEVKVMPFESIRVELSASLGTAKAKVTYEVQLDGWIVATDSLNLGVLHIQPFHSSSFPFDSTGNVEQIIDINNYGKDTINTHPWDPNARK